MELTQIVEMILQIMGALVTVATVLVRIPSLSKYSSMVGTIQHCMGNIIKYLPTLGINPKVELPKK